MTLKLFWEYFFRIIPDIDDYIIALFFDEHIKHLDCMQNLNKSNYIYIHNKAIAQNAHLSVKMKIKPE